MRTFGTMFVGGIAAILLFKLVAGLIFPLIALTVGLIGMMIKIALLIAIGWFVYSLVKGKKSESTV